jgi:site-specific recombinase XerD
MWPGAALRFQRAKIMPLEPIEPEAALELYLKDKKQQSAQSTIRSHKSRLGHFTDWCHEESINNMNGLSARKLHEFRIWRRSDPRDPNNVTMKTQLDTLRVFIRWCESIDAVPEGLAEKILSPDLDKHENEKDELLDPEVGDEILEHLQKYRYGTREHVVFVLIWRCLLRRGGMATIDTGDVVNDGDDPPKSERRQHHRRNLLQSETKTGRYH